MAGSCNMHVRLRNAYNILVGIHRSRSENCIEVVKGKVKGKVFPLL